MKKTSLWLAPLVLGLVLASHARAFDLEDEADADVADEVVEFHIPPGTGSKPWNTRQTMVKVKIGQTLRIVNDDSIKHRLHTFNNRPCEHQGPDSEPGELYDCVIGTTADPDVDLMYDHNVGASARFYVKATR